MIDFGTSCTSRKECKLWDHVAGGMPELLKKTNMTLDQYKSLDIWMLGNLYTFMLMKRPDLGVEPLALEMMNDDLLKRPSIETVISYLQTLMDKN